MAHEADPAVAPLRDRRLHGGGRERPVARKDDVYLSRTERTCGPHRAVQHQVGPGPGERGVLAAGGLALAQVDHHDGPATTHSGSSIQPPTVSVRRGSWSGTAGHLVAQCRGHVGSLVSAYPNPDWAYVIESQGPNVVRVRYKRVGEDRFVTVSARCVDGTPRLDVTSAVPGDD